MSKTCFGLFFILFSCALISLHGEESTAEEFILYTSSSNHFEEKIYAVSDYRSRGLSDTFQFPAIQGEIAYKHKSGLYTKIWASNVSPRIFNHAYIECDFYLGCKRALSQTKVTINCGGIFYYYPGGAASVKSHVSYNTMECFAAISYEKMEIQLSTTINDFYGTNSSNPPKNWNTRKPVKPNGHSYGSSYLEFNYEMPIYKKWRIAIHGGFQAVIHYSMLNYFDGQIGLVRAFSWCEFSLSYIQSTGKWAYYGIPNNVKHPSKRTNIAGATVVAALVKSF